MHEGNHCPFLNRTDARCSNHFSLDSLGHAFAYCFGKYQQCSMYGELLAERRLRRENASVGRDSLHAQTPIIQLTLHGHAAHATTSDRQHQRAA
ncbi:MAG TPA: hypothetical protein VIM11_18855 [Tepidisphaeraceae bacterium]